MESLQLKMQLLANWMQLYRLPDTLFHHQVRAQVIHRHRVPVTVVRAIRVTVKQVRNSNQYTQTHTYTHTSNWKYKKIHIYIIGKYIYMYSERTSLWHTHEMSVQKTNFFWIELIHLIYERKKESMEPSRIAYISWITNQNEYNFQINWIWSIIFPDTSRVPIFSTSLPSIVAVVSNCPFALPKVCTYLMNQIHVRALFYVMWRIRFLFVVFQEEKIHK